MKYDVIVFITAQQSLVGQGLLFMEDLLSHSDTPYSVRLLRTSDQPDAETSTWQYTSLTTNIHALGGILSHNSSKRSAADPRLDRAATGMGEISRYGGCKLLTLS